MTNPRDTPQSGALAGWRARIAYSGSALTHGPSVPDKDLRSPAQGLSGTSPKAAGWKMPQEYKRLFSLAYADPKRRVRVGRPSKQLPRSDVPYVRRSEAPGQAYQTAD